MRLVQEAGWIQCVRSRTRSGVHAVSPDRRPGFSLTGRSPVSARGISRVHSCVHLTGFERARLASHSTSRLRYFVPAPAPTQSRDRTASGAPQPAGAPQSRNLRAAAAAWLAVLGWSGVIWYLGGEDFSAPETRSTLVEILAWLGVELSAQAEMTLLMIVRKAAHVVEYGILAVLVSIAMRCSSRESNGLLPAIPNAPSAWTALAFVLALALADETRQAGSISRTGSPYDVLLDFCGGLIGVVALGLIDRWQQGMEMGRTARD